MNARFSSSLHPIPHFVKFFRDWSDEDPEQYIVDNIEEQGPQLHHVQSIISFIEPLVKDTKEHHLGINCFAGISRSTATGVIAWTMNGLSPSAALNEILEVRREAWPNLRILRLADSILKTNMFETVKKWKDDNKNNIFI